MSRGEYLFAEGDSFSFFQAREHALRQHIESLGDEALLGPSVGELVDALVEEYSVATPVLREEEKTVDHRETVVVTQDAFQRQLKVPAMEVKIFVPFTGDGDLFRVRPSTYLSIMPRGTVSAGQLVLPFEHVSQNPDDLGRAVERRLDEVRQYLLYVAEDVKRFNTSLSSLAQERIVARRQVREGHLGTVKALNIPLRRSANPPPAYNPVAVRRKVVVQPPRPAGKRVTPEATLAIREYDDILAALGDMAKVMERSPRAFGKMGEEDLRWVLLVALNSVYEGQATGETFNFTGKTDVLIRHENRNVFIGECKIWDGPKTLTDAIDQVLGYASWRDTKVAILLFNRRKNFSDVLAKIPDTVTAHPNYRRRVDYPSQTGFRFVLHHRDDAARELTLTVLVFEVPEEETAGS